MMVLLRTVGRLMIFAGHLYRWASSRHTSWGLSCTSPINHSITCRKASQLAQEEPVVYAHALCHHKKTSWVQRTRCLDCLDWPWLNLSFNTQGLQEDCGSAKVWAPASLFSAEPSPWDFVQRMLIPTPSSDFPKIEGRPLVFAHYTSAAPAFPMLVSKMKDQPVQQERTTNVHTLHAYCGTIFKPRLSHQQPVTFSCPTCLLLWNRFEAKTFKKPHVYAAWDLVWSWPGEMVEIGSWEFFKSATSNSSSARIR